MRALLCPKWEPDGDVEVLSGQFVILWTHSLSVMKSVIVSREVCFASIFKKSCASGASVVSGGCLSRSDLAVKVLAPQSIHSE